MSGIPDGARVLLDAMIFVYVLERHPDFERPCLQLLARMEKGKVKGGLPFWCSRKSFILTMRAVAAK